MNPKTYPRPNRVGRRRLAIVAVVTAALATALTTALAGPVNADTAPSDPGSPSTPTTVSADALPAPQIDGVVWTQAIAGNTVWAAGSFTTARPAGVALGGAGTVPRFNVLSYNLTTGVLNAGFAPQVNGAIRAIAVDSTGQHLWLGGSFTQVGGRTANHIAELNAQTGAVLTGFRGNINGTVNALALRSDKNTLFVGGGFSSADLKKHFNLAALTANAGTLRNWSPTATGGTVQAIAVAPDYSRVVVGGAFTALNSVANPGYGIGSLNPSTGQHQTWAMNSVIRNGGKNAAITTLAADSTGLYGGGYTYGSGGNLEGTFRADWKTGNLVWMEDCHGDTYSVAVTPTAEYVAGHAHYCGNVGGFVDEKATNYRGIAFSKAATQTITTNPVSGYANFAGQPAPSLLQWYPNFNVGTYTGQGQGPWSVAATSQYVVYGGEFTTVNGVAQQGLVRFAVSSIAPNKMGPQAVGQDLMPTSTVSYNRPTLSWQSDYDPDNKTLTYEIWRRDPQATTYTQIASVKGDSSVWNRPTMSWTEPNSLAAGKYFYEIVAVDPFGNQAIGQQTPVTVGG
ncbi:hypothetical protein [Frondihabitans australicus]|uniref:Fibronectin type-III domain-containing protein n=1 Tax=Frondihabitans australicus TaxID=386892 RepID=A0A495IIG0_9MICO|nr:hypothetical protein [Frondihabitans australicus]RKR75081.1 hypothetical protein C8E83_2218 [Frondihabitans australicus]